MRIWRKTAQKESSERGLARAALDGAPREELLREAMKALARHAPTGRLGVWLETDSKATQHDGGAAGFHGMVWARCSSNTPRASAPLSAEPPPPSASPLAPNP